MLLIKISKAAEADIEGIFNYTWKNFGLDQAVSYTSDFDNVFQNIVNNPKIGKERPEIRAELRSLSKDSHVIFYRISNDHIRIIRILHASQDLTKLLG